ncbi:putative sterol 3-beta-glucosyltransferase [Rosa chinensis]|uniref:Putative sterol 3-beta-glucosyltransferase n=1 Tax=Rosa chinensis TaxID=74649 RepID=A0A2P6Q575_ROSCH|nr:putative sterol 3-beta-glucosyltransferase [Rosa chinensis]
MNVITFYAPVLFKTIRFGSSASLASALITNGVNFFATFVSIGLADEFGRRFIFLEDGLQMFIYNSGRSWKCNGLEIWYWWQP